MESKTVMPHPLEISQIFNSLKIRVSHALTQEIAEPDLKNLLNDCLAYIETPKSHVLVYDMDLMLLRLSLRYWQVISLPFEKIITSFKFKEASIADYINRVYEDLKKHSQQFIITENSSSIEEPPLLVFEFNCIIAFLYLYVGRISQFYYVLTVIAQSMLKDNKGNEFKSLFSQLTTAYVTTFKYIYGFENIHLLLPNVHKLCEILRDYTSNVNLLLMLSKENNLPKDILRGVRRNIQYSILNNFYMDTASAMVVLELCVKEGDIKKADSIVWVFEAIAKVKQNYEDYFLALSKLIILDKRSGLESKNKLEYVEVVLNRLIGLGETGLKKIFLKEVSIINLLQKLIDFMGQNDSSSLWRLCADFAVIMYRQMNNAAPTYVGYRCLSFWLRCLQSSSDIPTEIDLLKMMFVTPEAFTAGQFAEQTETRDLWVLDSLVSSSFALADLLGSDKKEIQTFCKDIRDSLESLSQKIDKTAFSKQESLNRYVAEKLSLLFKILSQPFSPLITIRILKYIRETFENFPLLVSIYYSDYVEYVKEFPDKAIQWLAKLIESNSELINQFFDAMKNYKIIADEVSPSLYTTWITMTVMGFSDKNMVMAFLKNDETTEKSIKFVDMKSESSVNDQVKNFIATASQAAKASQMTKKRGVAEKTIKRNPTPPAKPLLELRQLNAAFFGGDFSFISYDQASARCFKLNLFHDFSGPEFILKLSKEEIVFRVDQDSKSVEDLKKRLLEDVNKAIFEFFKTCGMSPLSTEEGDLLIEVGVISEKNHVTSIKDYTLALRKIRSSKSFLYDKLKEIKANYEPVIQIAPYLNAEPLKSTKPGKKYADPVKSKEEVTQKENDPNETPASIVRREKSRTPEKEKQYRARIKAEEARKKLEEARKKVNSKEERKLEEEVKKKVDPKEERRPKEDARKKIDSKEERKPEEEGKKALLESKKAIIPASTNVSIPSENNDNNNCNVDNKKMMATGYSPALYLPVQPMQWKLQESSPKVKKDDIPFVGMQTSLKKLKDYWQDYEKQVNLKQPIHEVEALLCQLSIAFNIKRYIISLHCGGQYPDSIFRVTNFKDLNGHRRRVVHNYQQDLALENSIILAKNICTYHDKVNQSWNEIKINDALGFEPKERIFWSQIELLGSLKANLLAMSLLFNILNKNKENTCDIKLRLRSDPRLIDALNEILDRLGEDYKALKATDFNLIPWKKPFGKLLNYLSLCHSLRNTDSHATGEGVVPTNNGYQEIKDTPTDLLVRNGADEDYIVNLFKLYSLYGKWPSFIKDIDACINNMQAASPGFVK